MSKESDGNVFHRMDRMRWESNLLFSRVNGKIIVIYVVRTPYIMENRTYYDDCDEEEEIKICGVL